MKLIITILALLALSGCATTTLRGPEQPDGSYAWEIVHGPVIPIPFRDNAIVIKYEWLDNKNTLHDLEVRINSEGEAETRAQLLSALTALAAGGAVK